jgi:Uma2 family endonuclease
MSSTAHPTEPDRLPAVDARLVAPESRYEIDDGKVVYVSPSDEPHGSRHSKASALFEAHVRAEYDVASDMLTRTSEVDDMAPDVSVFPRARHPETGRRQLEELAVEIVSTETLSDAARKATKLAARGVRRIFAVDTARGRGFEWSVPLGTWQILADDAVIDDACLAVPLPLAALVSAVKADDAMARALLGKHNPVLEAALSNSRRAGKIEGKAESVLRVLEARSITLSAGDRVRILQVQDAAVLDAWLRRAATCNDAAELFTADAGSTA